MNKHVPYLCALTLFGGCVHTHRLVLETTVSLIRPMEIRYGSWTNDIDHAGFNIRLSEPDGGLDVYRELFPTGTQVRLMYYESGNARASIVPLSGPRVHMIYGELQSCRLNKQVHFSYLWGINRLLHAPWEDTNAPCIRADTQQNINAAFKEWRSVTTDHSKQGD